MTVIKLIVSSALCTKVKPCELQIALDFIFVKYTSHPCKYNAIKDMSAGFLALGISMLCCTVLLFVPTICLCLLKIEEKKRAYAKIVVSTFWWNRFQYFWFDMIFYHSFYGGIFRTRYFFFFENKIMSCARNNISYVRLICREFSN